MIKNVTVMDVTGTVIGTTYPKRARGLVKNGRALYVDDCTIRLSARAEPSDDKSEVNQMKYVLFNPREWFKREYQISNQGPFRQAQAAVERCFISGFDGQLEESLMFGNWNVAHTEVASKMYPLSPDTEYGFVFWLNGGENDNNDEVCQLRITFSTQPDCCNIYKLNRNFIKPLLHYQGWELYVIAFHTPEAGEHSETEEMAAIGTQFCFVAGKAPMAVKPAKEPDFYKDWQDMPDEFAASRLQRHNIVFEDGWPSIHQYGGNKQSTEALRNRQKFQTQFFSHQKGMEFQTKWQETGKDMTARGFGLENAFEGLKDAYQSLREQFDLGEEQEQLEEEINDAEEILSEYSDLVDEYSDLVDEANDKFSEAESQLEDISTRLQEMGEKLAEGTAWRYFLKKD